MVNLKKLLKEDEKDYLQISKLLNELYTINNDSKKEIKNKIYFFIENIKDLLPLKNLIYPKQKSINEKENKADNNNINIKDNEIKELKNAFNNIIKFADEINNIKEKNNKQMYIPYVTFKSLVDGFINKNLFKENKEKYKKDQIDPRQKAENTYNIICNLYEKNIKNYNKLYERLNTINMSYLEENQKNILIDITVKIYYKLTKEQKKNIKEKYSKLIKDEEICEILYFNSEDIFLDSDDKEKIIYRKIIESLSNYFEDFSNKKDENLKKKKISRENIFEILLAIYEEFLIYKNKENSYINLNNDNIIEKIYYFFIINFLSFEDIFIDENKFIKFLYIKYLYDYNYDFLKVIQNKEKIKKEIKIDDLEKFDSDNEEEDSMPNMIVLMDNLKKIIPEKYIKIYLEVQNNISNFYIIPFPINCLVNSNNIYFTFNIIDMIIFNNNYYNINDNNEWLIKYRNNLIKLEKDIYNHYIKSTWEYVCREGESKLTGYKINDKMKSVYNKLTNILINRLPVKEYYEIQFIPFGSVTQFLNGENGDIDLFLYLKKNSDNIPSNFNERKYLQDILNKLYVILKKIDEKISFHQTNRLCLFTIDYEGIKIDINVYGICSYYGEILLREYSLMDFRFPMLVIYLKHIISVHHIKNVGDNKSYINSFAWTNILLTFLQDILDPPLFPRLLNDDNKQKIKIKVGGGKGEKRRKELYEEIEYQNDREFYVMNIDKNNKIQNSEIIKRQFYNYDKNKYDNSSNEEYLHGKNKMSCAEILIKFVQFIGYFFSYKYTMVNTCYEYQSFMPKIEKNNIKDEFTKLFFRKCEKDENENEDKLLIREPFDYSYNPCKSVPFENLDEIQKKFRNIYFNILEFGEIIK